MAALRFQSSFCVKFPVFPHLLVKICFIMHVKEGCSASLRTPTFSQGKYLKRNH